jgi:hypothetical protein
MLASGADVNGKMVDMDTNELAWAAGFFDGEGHSYWRWSIQSAPQNRKGWYRCFKSQVGISQAHDPQCVERFQAALGGLGKIRPYTNKHGRIYMWTVQAIDEVESVLLTLWPYLSHPKREQAGAVLTAIKARKASPYYSVSRKGMGGRPVSKLC